jgi:predicted metal-dependent peptidase
MSIDKNDSLAKAIKALMLAEPFYGLFLMSINKTWDKNPRCNTLMVTLKGINYEIDINTDFWNSLPPLQQIGLIKHEVGHILFFHLTDFEDLQNREIANVSADIEINQYIDRTWLPEEGCFLENFPELNMEKRKGTRYYYEKLMQDAQSNDPNTFYSAICSDSPAGDQDTDSDGNGDGDSNGNGNGKQVQLPNGQTIVKPNHTWDADVSKLSETTKKLIAAQTKHLVNSVAEQVIKSRGTIPGEISELIERLNKIEPPKFDWKGYMRRFVGNSTKTYTKLTRSKVNKRIYDNPGIRIKTHKHILACIDTSGSVSTKELTEFLNELYHLKRLSCEVTILQFDTCIRNISKFDIKKDLIIHGRGGTDFNEAVDYYIENKNRYSCMMIFTDGEAPAPQNSTRDMLWVLSQQSKLNTSLPGKVIKLDL